MRNTGTNERSQRRFKLRKWRHIKACEGSRLVVWFVVACEHTVRNFPPRAAYTAMHEVLTGPDVRRVETTHNTVSTYTNSVQPPVPKSLHIHYYRVHATALYLCRLLRAHLLAEQCRPGLASHSRCGDRVVVICRSVTCKKFTAATQNLSHSLTTYATRRGESQRTACQRCGICHPILSAIHVPVHKEVLVQTTRRQRNGGRACVARKSQCLTLLRTVTRQK